MEQVTINPLAQEVDPKPPFTLDGAREELRSLLRAEELNAWEIGDLLNRIERSGLVRSKGYGKTKSWLDAEVPECYGKTSTLYRYAYVAAHYTKEDVRLWGIARLEYLMVHDQETVGDLVAGDPAQREIELALPGGLKQTKRFCECTANELRLSNQLRKQNKSKAKPAPLAKAVASTVDEPSPWNYSARQALVLLALGIVVAPLGGLLPSPVSFWVGVLGLCLFLAGSGALLWHARMLWKRFLAAVKEGRGIAFLKETSANVRHGSKKLAAAVRSGIKANPSVSSEEPPPPTQKKAA